MPLIDYLPKPDATTTPPPVTPGRMPPASTQGQGIGRFLPPAKPTQQPLPSPANILGNLPGIAQIGQAGRVVAGAVGPAGNLPGIAQIGQAGRAVGRPLGVVWNAARTLLSAPAEATEHVLTGGQGYEQRFRQQGADPAGAKVLSALFKGVLDPTNLLAAPGAIGKVLGTSKNVAETAYQMARASGVTEPIARTTAAATRLLNEGRLTGPIIQRLSDHAIAGLEQARLALNKYHGTPPTLRQIVKEYYGDLRVEASAAIQKKVDILDRIPTPSDRILLTHALEGTVPETALPDHLLPAYRELIVPSRDAATKRAVDSGMILEARDNYVRHLYGPEAYAKIKAGAIRGTGPITKAVPPMSAREYEAQRLLETIPEEGRRGVYGRQVTPTRGLRGLTGGFQRQRTFDTIEDATKAGIRPIEDSAILLPAHDLEVGIQAANKTLYDKVVRLGDPWVRPFGPDLPPGYVKMQDLIGVGPSERYGWSGLMVHPRVADVVKDLYGRGEYGLNQLLTVPTVMNNTLRRFIFLNPIIHGQNQVRAAFLSEHWNVLNPRYWQEVGAASQDAREMGPITRARLAAGGTMSGGNVGRMIGNTIDEIMLRTPANEAVRNTGLLQRVWRSEEVQRTGKVFRPYAFVRALNDELLWNVMDAGGRNVAFQHALQQLAPHMPQEQAAQAAARYADLVWNNYSKEEYGKIEKVLNSMMFTYAWTRGRGQFFGAIGKSFLPGGNPVEKELYKQMAARWGMYNVVLPHIYRAWIDKQSAGMAASRLPIGEYQDQYGRTRPLYIKPSGWYSDVVDFAEDPVAFAMARMNPGLRVAADLYTALNEAGKTGQNKTQVFLKSVLGTLADVYPAGLSQATQPGATPLMRILPAVGVPVTGPPPSENPRMLMREKIDSGDYYAAGVAAKRAGLPFYRTIVSIPPNGRSQFRKGYDAAGGVKAPSGLPSLRMPKLP